MPIDDDEVLWRRVPGDRKKAHPPENPTSWKPFSDNFRGRKHDDGVSVDRASLHHPRGPAWLLAQEPLADETWGVLAISVADVRATRTPAGSCTTGPPRAAGPRWPQP